MLPGRLLQERGHQDDEELRRRVAPGGKGQGEKEPEEKGLEEKGQEGRELVEKEEKLVEREMRLKLYRSKNLQRILLQTFWSR